MPGKVNGWNMPETDRGSREGSKKQKRFHGYSTKVTGVKYSKEIDSY